MFKVTAVNSYSISDFYIALAQYQFSAYFFIKSFQVWDTFVWILEMRHNFEN